MMAAMDFVLQAIALCRQGLAHFGEQPGGLGFSLFLAGLGGSLTHCAGMCGPFVLGQVMADAERATGYGEWRRLAGAALAPYHLGRITTYTALGALAGAATALFAATASFAWISALLLIAGAGFMLLQAFGLAASAGSPLGPALARLAAPLSSLTSAAGALRTGSGAGLPAVRTDLRRARRRSWNRFGLARGARHGLRSPPARSLY